MHADLGTSAFAPVEVIFPVSGSTANVTTWLESRFPTNMNLPDGSKPNSRGFAPPVLAISTRLICPFASSILKIAILLSPRLLP